MKENFFKSIKDNVKNAFSFQDSDEYYDDEEYLDEQDVDVDEPQNSTNLPPYQPYERQQSAQNPAYQPYGAGEQDNDNQPRRAKKASSNIYNMNEVKPVQKLKVTFYVLEDMDDARNIADCMIDRTIVTLCNLGNLTEEEERRVLDFLDGVKYVCKSKIENISSHIYLVVPETAELSGDFMSQVDTGSFYG